MLCAAVAPCRRGVLGETTPGSKTSRATAGRRNTQCIACSDPYRITTPGSPSPSPSSSWPCKVSSIFAALDGGGRVGSSSDGGGGGWFVLSHESRDNGNLVSFESLTPRKTEFQTPSRFSFCVLLSVWLCWFLFSESREASPSNKQQLPLIHHQIRHILWPF